jgi:ABC-2 type transport system permease protein
MLLRPYPITWQVMGSSFALRRLGRILEGLAVFLFGLSIIHVNWTFAKLMYLPVVFSSQVIAFGSLFIAGSTLIFWTVQPIEALNIVTYGGNELMTYPMHIYSGWIQRFFTYVIPFIFMNYYPALYFLDKPDPLKMPVIAPFLAPAAAVWMLAAALAFWRFGIRQYQGTGS